MLLCDADEGCGFHRETFTPVGSDGQKSNNYTFWGGGGFPDFEDQGFGIYSI